LAKKFLSLKHLNMFRFHKTYFLLTILLFLTEVLIALYVHDNFIRPWFGDFLVVILLYCFLRSFVAISSSTAALLVLVFSFSIEMAQYFKLVNLLQLQDNKIARTVIGTTFEWTDLVAYSFGITFVLVIENYLQRIIPPGSIQKIQPGSSPL
jgi:uncharacterized membrane protein YfcA